MALAPNEAYAPLSYLSPPTEEERQIVARAEARRVALMGDQQVLRTRYEEIMRWLNPPWDELRRGLNPRPDALTAIREGEPILHVDLANPTVDRMAVLQMGVAPIFRCKPKFVRPPIDDPNDPEGSAAARREYNFDRAIAQAQSTQIENQTQEWIEANALHRTLLWAVWAKEAFGKSVIKTGWDPDIGIPTAELYENPSTVYYGWTKRYGRRQIAWAMVVDEMAPEEASVRFGIDLPIDSATGMLSLATWTGVFDQGDMDQRPEQQQEMQRYVTVEEYWELADNPDPSTGGPKRGVMFSLILAGRVIEGPTWYPWKKVPFHVLEAQHIPTWSHGKSLAEVVIPINAALDDMWDRQHQVIQFESGPRFKGLNMVNSGDEVDIPDPFHLVPLREGEDIAQIETRIDFFPTELHSNQLFEGLHRSTGLTPIAWGMSPNAQTSGRAMSAEWRAVELPLTGKLVNMTPEIRDIFECWWDYAEAYSAEHREVADGYRRFQVIWVPLDIRDKTEKTAELINMVTAGLLDPETAIEEAGYQNVDEILARIEAYFTNPIHNPLRYQQYLTLQQLELTIRQQQLQVAQMEAEAAQAGGAPAGAPSPSPAGPPAPGEAPPGPQQEAAPTAGSEALNQPGQQVAPPGGGSALPIDTSILSQTPLVGGVGNRAIVDPTGGAPVVG